MHVMRWQPDGVHRRHHPDRVIHADRQQAAHRGEQLAARVGVRFRLTHAVVAPGGDNDGRAVGPVDQPMVDDEVTHAEIVAPFSLFDGVVTV